MENVNIGTVENDGTGEKLRNAFNIINENFQELSKNYKELIASATYSESVLTINTPLTIGNTYFISFLSPGDNFSNVGYTGDQFFVATGEYPVSWTSTVVKEINMNVTVYTNTFNTVTFTPELYGELSEVFLKVKVNDSLNDLNTTYDSNLGFIDGAYYSKFGYIFNIKRYS